MRLAAFPPGKGDITNMVRAYIHRCEKDGVRIILDQEVTLELIRKENPDAVIVATGAKPLVLPIEGIDQLEILSGSAVLDGTCAPGKKVLVVGGGMVGCEIAALLGEQEHEVDVIELRGEIGADVIREHKIYLMKDFEQYRIGQITGAKVCRFYKDGVEYEGADGVRHEARGYDSVVLAMGYRSCNPFAGQIEKLGKEVYVIGDAHQARRALEATSEAYQAAIRL